ncbi:hypothetical protein Tco_0973725 [Tanacetum coccineum]
MDRVPVHKSLERSAKHKGTSRCYGLSYHGGADLIKVCKETKKELGLVTAKEAELKAKYDGIFVGLDENLSLLAFEKRIKLRLFKVVPYIAMELYHSDEVGKTVRSLVKATIFHGRCSALDEVAATKKPVDLLKVECYRPTDEDEYNKVGNAYITIESSPLKPPLSAHATTEKTLSPFTNPEKPNTAKTKSQRILCLHPPILISLL